MGLVILGLIFGVIPIGLLVVIILFATRKSTESFENKIRTIYLYIVLLIALVATVYGLIQVIISVTDVLVPTQINMTTDDTHELYNKLIGSAGIVVVCLPLFLFHKKKLDKK